MNRNLQLLIIDPQNDFCDLPESYLPLDPLTGRKTMPALPVAGAHSDMQRIAQIILAGGAGLRGISVTLDSHHKLDVAHPTFWQRADGTPVEPFTQITSADVRAGTYQPRDPSALERVLVYLDALEAAGRYTLMVWPVHCEIGSWGHNVHADVLAACGGWEQASLRNTHVVIKGTNPWTEHYSAVQAEVPDPDDDSTQLNRAFLDRLAQAERLYITGEAGSHCVKATTEHIVANFGQRQLAKLVLVTDCMSAVAGFGQQYRDFVADMAARGVQLATAAEVIRELQGNA